MGDIQQELYVLHSMAGLYEKQGQYSEAVVVYQSILDTFVQVLPPFSDLSPEMSGIFPSVMSKIVEMYRRLGQYQQAITKAEEMKEIMAKFGYPRQTVELLTEMADTYRDSGNLLRAANYFVLAGDLSVQGDIPVVFEYEYGNNMNYTFLKSSLAIYEEAITLFRQTGDLIAVADTLVKIADLYTTYLDREMALQRYRDALQIYQANNEPGREIDTLGKIALNHFAMGDSQTANTIAQEAFNSYQVHVVELDWSKLDLSSPEFEHLDTMTMLIHQLAENHSATGNTRVAIEQYERVLSIYAQAQRLLPITFLIDLATLYKTDRQYEKAATLLNNFVPGKSLQNSQEIQLLSLKREIQRELHDNSGEIHTILRLCSFGNSTICSDILPLIEQHGFAKEDLPILHDIIRHLLQDWSNQSYSALDIEAFFTSLLPLYQSVTKNYSWQSHLEHAYHVENLAHMYAMTLQHDLAIDSYKQALILYRRLNMPESEHLLYTELVRLYGVTKDFDARFAAFQTWYAILQEMDSQMSYADWGRGGPDLPLRKLLDSIDNFEQLQGHYEKAIELNQWAAQIAMSVYEEAISHTFTSDFSAAELGNFMGVYQRPAVDLLLSQGELLSTVGDYESSLKAFSEAIEVLESFGEGRGHATTIAESYLRMGIISERLDIPIYRDAKEYYIRARDITLEPWDGSGMDVTVTAIINLASTFASTGHNKASFYYNYSAILHQMKYSIQDSFIPSQLFSLNHIEMARTLTALGNLYQDEQHELLMINMHQRALGLYEQFLNEHQGSDEAKIDAIVASSEGYEKIGMPVKAIEKLVSAIELVESLRGNLNSDIWKTGYAGEHTEIYSHLIELLVEHNRWADAFGYNERGLARTFLDQIGNQYIDVNAGSTPELVETEQNLRQEITDIQMIINAEETKPLSEQDVTILDAANKNLDQVRQAHQSLLDRLKVQNPQYASLVSVNTLTLEQIQDTLLDDDTTLIEYRVLDTHTVAWVIDKQDSKAIELTITKKELLGKIRYLNDSIQAKEFDEITAIELYDRVFAPLQPFVKHKNLMIVSHDVLHYLPFAVLKNSQGTGFLIEDYAIAYTPSASILKYILNKRNLEQNRILAMGNPDHSLPNAGTEVQTISQIFNYQPFIGKQATESQLYKQARNIDILHLAAHGVYDPYNPLYTRIELSADGGNDGNLEVHEIYDMNLSSTNLVVLSACNTALGQQSKGDEIVGLTRAFLYAGSPAVVTTLWSISDDASGQLMVSFYRHLRQGMGNSEALRAAQLEILRQPQWASPYYWAAFTLTGDYWGHNN